MRKAIVSDRWMVAAAAAAALTAGACKREGKPSIFYVDRIAVSETTLANNASLDLDGDGLRLILTQALGASGQIRILQASEKPPPGSRPFHCRGEVAFTRESESTGTDPPGSRVEVGVSVELARPGKTDMDRFEEKGIGRYTFDPRTPSDRIPAFRKALGQALETTIQSVLLQMRAADKKDEELIADLSSPDPRLRDYAVRVLTERRNPAAVPDLIKRLSDPDPDVALRTIGALRALGDPRAVPALIAFTRNRDADVLLPAIDAIGAIGGPDAEAYLFTLESGHQDETIRQSAAAAAKELRKRRERQTKPGSEQARVNKENP